MCKKRNPLEVAEAVNSLVEALKDMPSKEVLWLKIATTIRNEEEKLNKLIHIKIEMSSKFYDVSDVDFQILFSRICIKVLKEILDDKI
jgi:hypothetical protein